MFVTIYNIQQLGYIAIIKLSIILSLLTTFLIKRVSILFSLNIFLYDLHMYLYLVPTVQD